MCVLCANALTPNAAAVRSLGFSEHILQFPLSFSLSKNCLH